MESGNASMKSLEIKFNLYKIKIRIPIFKRLNPNWKVLLLILITIFGIEDKNFSLFLTFLFYFLYIFL